MIIEGWEESLLGDVSSKITKGSTPTTYGFKYQNEGINFIKIENVIDGKIDKKSIYQFISEEAHENQKRSQLLDGDVLFSIAGTIGETCLITKDLLPANTNQAFAIISGFNQVLDANFLRKQLDSFVSRKLKDKARGGAMNNVSLTDLKNLKVVIPSLVEQKKLVEKIEELFSDLDKGVADLKKAQDQLKVYRQAVLKKAFEGDFTKSWRDSKELNSDWTTYTFAEITESLKRGPFGGDLKKSFFVENGYAVYEQQHAINNDFTTIRYHIDQERYDKLKACNVGPGDYIVSCSGTMGKIARLPKGSPNGVINQALLRIRINESIISHEYFLEYFRSALFQRKILKDSRGSGMQNMAGIKEIKPIRIKVPTLLEQSQIIKEIESRLSICNKVEISITESLEKAEVLRQSILKKAFEGNLLSTQEIEKCKTASDYEPASVLLKKIKNI